MQDKHVTEGKIIFKFNFVMQLNFYNFVNICCCHMKYREG